jgi:LysR family nitrogen assimilation transcriptional regulator
MKLNQIRYFAAVYEEGSITLAAKRENATQSGISMQIKDMETRLGARLFDRTSSGVKPTLPGEKFYIHATRILRELNSIQDEFCDLADEDAVEIKIGLMPTFTRAILAPSLVAFSKLRPHARLKVFEAYSGYLTDEIVHQRLDFAIVPANSNVRGITTQYLATDVEFLVTSIDTDRPHLQQVDLRNESALQIVLPGATNARRTKIDTHLATLGISPDSIMELDAMMGTLDLVARSDWVTILPGVLCAPDRDGRDRKIHPLAGLPLTVDYVLIESATKPMPPAARLLAKIIETEMNVLILEA